MCIRDSCYRLSFGQFKQLVAGGADSLTDFTQALAAAKKTALGASGVQRFGQRQAAHDVAGADLRIGVGAEGDQHRHGLADLEQGFERRAAQ